MEKETDHIRQLTRLAIWIEKIGSDYEGAILNLFRSEGICYALPPNAKYLDMEIDLDRLITNIEELHIKY
jgi:hypothetical protein